MARMDKLTGFAADFGPEVNFQPEALRGWSELCDMSDVLRWVLDEMPMEEIESGRIADLTE